MRFKRTGTKKGRKPRTRSYAALKRALDKTYSEWVRRKGADSQGFVRCVTCGRSAHWKSMQCGHFIPRHYLAGRWNPENTAVQDASCNIFKRGAYPEFAQWGTSHYGQDWLPRMIALKREQIKWTRMDLESLLEDYTKRLAHLEQTSTLSA